MNVNSPYPHPPSPSGAVQKQPEKNISATLFPRPSGALLGMLAGWLLLSFFAVSYFTDNRLAADFKQHSTELNQTAEAVTYHFERSLAFLNVMPETIADNLTVITTLRSLERQSSWEKESPADKRLFLNSRNDVADLNHHLAAQKKELNVDVIWVLAANGDCIASSNHDRPESFVGISYSDRAYFKSAKEGTRGRQYAVGRQTNIPGLFFSAPIYDGLRVIGAVTVKIDVTTLSQWFNRFNCFVTDASGVVILSSDKRIDLHALNDAPVFQMTTTARDKQYKRRDFKVLNIGNFGAQFSAYPSLTLPESDNRFLLARSQPSKDGYTIFTYAAMTDVEQLRIVKFQFTILVFISGAALILLVTGMRRYLRDMRDSIAMAEAGSRAKSTFLANMSHEIRTPMNGIIGMTELCLTTKIDAEQQTYLNAVKRSADNLLSIINDILDFSKIEVGKIERDDVPFLLCTTIGQTLQGIAVRATEKGLEVLFDPAPEIPDALIGDPGRLRQILINLVGNAIKFTARGQVIVSVQVVEEDEEMCTLSFSIQDHGIGIAPEKLGKIFDPFEQGDISTTKSYGGTGLGLTISRSLVELMDGTIRVESELGSGSTFIFTARFGIQQIPPAVHHELPLTGCSALVVDDIATNRDILANFLGKWGLRVTAAENAATALKMLDESTRMAAPFDFALIDVQMPECDGWQLVEQIRRQPVHDSVHCILLPSAGMRGDSKRCRELRVDGYLTKPIIHTEVHDLLCLLISSGSSPGQAENIPVTRYQILENRQRLAILVAEDVQINQILIETILARYGHAVTIAGNGEEAVQAWQDADGSYDLIFMDVQMPVMDGFEATRMIRERERERAGGGHIPIIAMTAYAMKEDMERCREAGMDDYISKPFQPEDIVTVLKRIAALNVELNSPATPNIPENNIETVLVFDKKGLLVRLGGKDDMLQRFLILFEKNVSGYLEALRLAVEGGNVEQIRLQAHSIKGASANISAHKMVESASYLEMMARDGGCEELSERVTQLEAEFVEFNRVAQESCQEKTE